MAEFDEEDWKLTERVWGITEKGSPHFRRAVADLVQLGQSHGPADEWEDGRSLLIAAAEEAAIRLKTKV